MNTAKGQPSLDSHALQVAAGALLDRWGVQVDKATPMAREVIRAYLLAKPQVGDSHYVSPLTHELAKMTVGDIRFFPQEDRHVWHSRMETARKLLESPEARWRHLAMRDGTSRLLRLPDGCDQKHDPWSNERAVFLAQIPVGRTDLATMFKNRKSLETNLKLAARRILGKPEANWSARTTQLGVIVKRIA